MDSYEATRMVMTKIQALDPENASKIMGYILIQDLGEKEMIRLALGPDTLLVSLMNQAKNCLGLGLTSPNSNSFAAKSPAFGTNRPNPFSQTSPRILIPNSNGFHHHLNSPNPSSPSPTSPWSTTSSASAAAFSRNSPRPATYAAVVNGANNASGPSFFSGNNNNNNSCNNNSNSNNNNSNSTSGDLSDEFVVGNLQVQEQLSFLDESMEHHNHHPLMSPSGRSDSMLFPYGNCCEDPTSTTTTSSTGPHQMVHRRSCSVNDAFLLGGGGGGEDGGGGGGFGWRPCMYYARGFCKNGSTCKFLHGAGFDSPDISVDSPTKIDGGFDEFLRIKAFQQQRLAAASHLISSAPQHPFAYNNHHKTLTFFNENQRSAAAAIMMGEEFHKFGRYRPERSNFSSIGLDAANSSSRQIYLTFPADSTFKEEDVSNYFSMYGPVQDVRIPYQQKRMFGFVTFVYPETVKLILAKGNPHFVCDSRVLVKPYKEKGKVAEKKHQQQQQQLMDRGEFSPCLSPSGFDSREPFDIPFGAGMFYNSQEMMLRRKFEEQAIDLQGRRLMSMQLMDLKNHHNSHQFQPCLSPAGPIPSPRQINQSFVLLSDGGNVEVQEDISSSQEAANSPTVATNGKVTPEATESSDDNNDSESGNKVENANVKDSDLHESFDHILPENLFASPTKAVAERHSLFSSAPLTETVVSTPSTNKFSTIGMLTPPKSCNFQTPPRFSSGQEATIEM